MDPTTKEHDTRRLQRWALVAVAATSLAVTLMMAVTTGNWINRTFPGFFVLPNRVVPSIGLAAWRSGEDGSIYQQVVAAVDGVRVEDSAQIYARVENRPIASPIAYTLRSGSTSQTVIVRSRAFTRVDYLAIFGAYLATGLLYLGIAMIGAWVNDEDLGRALLYLGGIAGIYALSGATLYGPHASLRVHAMAEAFFPAALVYLACVLPRLRARVARPLIAGACWLSLALAIAYQLLLGQPAAYSIVHATCEAYLGLAGLALGARLIIARTSSADRAGPLLNGALAGVLSGLGVPAVVLTISGISGGNVPVNVCTATAFLFPLCLGYGLLRERLGSVPNLVALPPSLV